MHDTPSAFATDALIGLQIRSVTWGIFAPLPQIPPPPMLSPLLQLQNKSLIKHWETWSKQTSAYLQRARSPEVGWDLEIALKTKTAEFQMAKQQVQSFNYEFWPSVPLDSSLKALWRPRRALLIEILKPRVQVATSDIAFCKMLRRREMNIVFFTHTWVLTLGVQRQVRVNEFSFPVLRWSRVGRLSPRILSRKQQINGLEWRWSVLSWLLKDMQHTTAASHIIFNANIWKIL